MRIELISTGDEVITGNIDDTNASFLCRELADCGKEVVRRHTVGDSMEELKALFTEVAERDSLILVTGGLGPTNDDLTTQAIAQVAHVPLELNGFWLDHMRHWFEVRGKEMARSNFKQAMLPQGSVMINNPVGTACGFALKVNKAYFIFAPGVPKELKSMWQASIKEMVLACTGGDRTQILSTYRMTLTGLSESLMAEFINRIPLPADVTFGDRAFFPFLELKLVGRNADAHIIAPLYEKVAKLFSRYFICKGSYNPALQLKEAQISIPFTHLIDGVCQGDLIHEMRKLSDTVLSCSILNTASHELSDGEKTYQQLLLTCVPQSNSISLIPVPVITTVQEKPLYHYILTYKLNVTDHGEPRQVNGILRFTFHIDAPSLIMQRRVRAYMALLSAVELTKFLLGEPLIAPNDCLVEIVKHEDSKPGIRSYAEGVVEYPDLEQEITQLLASLKAESKA